MTVKFRFNLKAPNKEKSLLMFLCRWNGKQIKISTKFRVVVETWNPKEQVCYINKRRFSNSVNLYSFRVNRFISLLSERVVDFYDENQQYIESYIVHAGDIVILKAGGHGFKVIERADIFEVKQGPYLGAEDKVRFEPIADADAIIKE